MKVAEPDHRARMVLFLILLFASLIRVADFPARYEMRDGDEFGYATDGLLLWEGLTPGHKFSPAGPLTWMGWAYGAVMSAKNAAWPDKEMARTPVVLRPYMAVDRALFDLYRDSSTLRATIVAVITAFSLVAVWAGFWLGYSKSGLAGAVLTASLAGFLPIYVAYAGMARPYSIAWSAAILAHYCAATRNCRGRWLGAAIFMALSISSRIEMIVYWPFVGWEFWRRSEPGSAKIELVKCAAITSLVALVVSPWMLTNLLGNLRSVATVRFSGPGMLEVLLETLRGFAIDEGFGLVLAMCVLGFCLMPRSEWSRHWSVILFLGFVILCVFKPSPFGFRHQGPTLVALVTLSALALNYIQRRWLRFSIAIVVCAVGVAVVQGVSLVYRQVSTYVADEATKWVEKHVKPGTIVYLGPTFNDPLPTVQSSDALWSAVAGPEAWKVKLKRGLDRFGVGADQLPRALSEENLVGDRAMRRRWFLLGSRQDLDVPRFNLVLFSGGSPFDVSLEEVAKRFAATDGVLIWRGSPRNDCGKPVAAWVNANGQGTFIYCRSTPCLIL